MLGSGLEMAAFCGWVQAGADAVFGLPELSLGLIPGAGGTVSITRRIGRWRTAYLVLSGRRIDSGDGAAVGTGRRPDVISVRLRALADRFRAEITLTDAA